MWTLLCFTVVCLKWTSIRSSPLIYEFHFYRTNENFCISITSFRFKFAEAFVVAQVGKLVVNFTSDYWGAAIENFALKTSSFSFRPFRCGYLSHQSLNGGDNSYTVSCWSLISLWRRIRFIATDAVIFFLLFTDMTVRQTDGQLGSHWST